MGHCVTVAFTKCGQETLLWLFQNGYSIRQLKLRQINSLSYLNVDAIVAAFYEVKPDANKIFMAQFKWAERIIISFNIWFYLTATNGRICMYEFHIFVSSYQAIDVRTTWKLKLWLATWKLMWTWLLITNLIQLIYAGEATSSPFISFSAQNFMPLHLSFLLIFPFLFINTVKSALQVLEMTFSPWSWEAQWAVWGSLSDVVTQLMTSPKQGCRDVFKPAVIQREHFFNKPRLQHKVHHLVN